MVRSTAAHADKLSDRIPHASPPSQFVQPPAGWHNHESYRPGLRARMTQTLTTDVAIIGAGPVGLFAVFELGMLKLSGVLIDALSDIGGQCSALYPEKPIYDIPGSPSIEAGELIARLDTQIAPFAAPRLLGRRVERLSGEPGSF